MLREAILAGQRELGVVPADAELTARPDVIPAWDEMDDARENTLVCNIIGDNGASAEVARVAASRQ